MDPQPGQDSDPLSQNSYMYTENNPTHLVDPSGTIAISLRIPGIGWVKWLANGAIIFWGVRYSINSWVAHRVRYYLSKKSNNESKDIKKVKDKYLEKKGINAHDLKKEFVGGRER
ncbi:hypothetical protein [Heyndrickxia coagulans]|nr:hypothetical protein [Heyndrickxia coagulans]MED4941622.1 hypothetical protein [Heyndrickxia coagulans]MED4965320.1 hypothetical protein [Heyndrickxia coagulans]